jgi:hypothetical protein
VIPDEEAVEPGPLGGHAQLDELVRVLGEVRHGDPAQQS